MYYALWDRRHAEGTGISQCARRHLYILTQRVWNFTRGLYAFCFAVFWISVVAWYICRFLYTWVIKTHTYVFPCFAMITFMILVLQLKFNFMSKRKSKISLKCQSVMNSKQFSMCLFLSFEPACLYWTLQHTCNAQELDREFLWDVLFVVIYIYMIILLLLQVTLPFLSLPFLNQYSTLSARPTMPFHTRNTLWTFYRSISCSTTYISLHIIIFVRVCMSVYGCGYIFLLTIQINLICIS